ncbi:hypothetical protein J5N97_002065 [Dioscorea zingiberensis]|uniref:ATP-dependent DNA helicase RecQ zinc-binding domain-containing protein n=1 Tax=Dioscorea zingiberensis TaxID=325984 RepID=A0A9D5BT42_9LILI|nr:hypothetical protein J5N97_002065 [Dioscorea zingiberensis]
MGRKNRRKTLSVADEFDEDLSAHSSPSRTGVTLMRGESIPWNTKLRDFGLRISRLSWPQSLEAYYQEAGRAGRDGKLSDCTLYVNLSRIPTLLPSQRSEEQTKQAYRMLSDCFRYGMNTSSCRARTLVKYFGTDYNLLIMQFHKYSASDRLWWQGLARILEDKGYIREGDGLVHVCIKYPEPTQLGLRFLQSGETFDAYPEADMLLSMEKEKPYSSFSDWGRGWADPEIRRQRLQRAKSGPRKRKMRSKRAPRDSSTVRARLATKLTRVKR